MKLQVVVLATTVALTVWLSQRADLSREFSAMRVIDESSSGTANVSIGDLDGADSERDTRRPRPDPVLMS